jgi:L-arabinokinase
MHSTEVLRREFNEPGRRWAGYLAGCLHLLHQEKLIDLLDTRLPGLNIALYSTIPLGAGVSSSAAIEIATMINLRDHFQLESRMDAMKLAAMCQAVENQIVGTPCGIMDQVSSCSGRAGALLRLVCQPHELLAALALPPGIRVIGINSNVKHSVGGGMYPRTRCAAFMGHRIILETMRQMGELAGKPLIADPMHGYLANLPQDDYKRYFRTHVPEFMLGRDFLRKYGSTIDTATTVDPDFRYPVQHGTDHHVLEARRVRRFAEFLENAALQPQGTRAAGSLLDRAGHLMYASHLSYTNDAMLGAEECDLLVKMVRDRERFGLYGAKITGGGSGGTVAVLADQGPHADAAIADILDQYEQRTGRKPEAFLHSSPGAWEVGTKQVML